MQAGLEGAREGIEALDTEVQALRRKVGDPFRRVVELQEGLRRYDAAGELVGRVARVVRVARRLEGQMEVLFSKKEKGEEGEGEDAVLGAVRGRDLARAALLISELSTLLALEEEAEGCSILEVKLVTDLLPTIDSARGTVVEYMEDMIVRGLRDLSPIMLASSLQTAFNLNTLPSLVRDLLSDLTEVVKERTASAFDLDTLSRQLNHPTPSTSGRRGEKRQQQEEQLWADAIWKRLESLIVTEMGAVCSKVYLLEKVLKLKSDEDSGVNFLESAMEVLEDKPSKTFWLTFSQALSHNITTATGRSTWLAQLLSNGYPRLLRYFQDFFGKIGVYTDVQYSATQQSPETVVLLRALGGVERAFVDKATLRVAEGLGSVVGGGRRGLGGEEEAEAVVRAISNALDGSRFDPLLSRAVVDRSTALVEQYTERLGGVVASDAAAFTMEGSATQAQGWNASLVRFSYALVKGLESAASEEDSPSTNTAAATGSSYAATRLHTASETVLTQTRTLILTPLLTHLQKSLRGAMGKMHTHLTSRSSTQKSKTRGVEIDSTSGASAYISEACDMLWHLRERLLPLYPSELRAGMANAVAGAAVELFLLHASLLSLPDGEEGDRVRLKLATDMTELEFSVAQLVGDLPKQKSARGWFGEGQGDVFKGMKVFRRILFLSLEEVEKEVSEKKGELGLSEKVLALHVLCRQPGAIERLVSAAGGKGRGNLVEYLLSHPLEEVFKHITSSATDADSVTSRILSLLAP